MRTVARMIAATQRAQRPFSAQWPNAQDTVIDINTGLEMRLYNHPYRSTNYSVPPSRTSQWRVYVCSTRLTGVGIQERDLRDIVRW
jgi:hypothetical protein